MASQSPDRQNLITQVPSVPYKSGQLTDVLLDLQHEWATGIAHIEVLSAAGISQYSLVFRNGAISYAGRSIPTPYEFVTELSLYSHIENLDTVLQFAAKRSSVRDLLQAMVETGVLRWSEITQAMQKQVREILEELLPTTGRVSFESDAGAFDLQYGGGEGGFLIDALLLEQELRSREQEPDEPTAGQE